MFDAFATATAIVLGGRDHRNRRDLLMFSALPDAPVLPVEEPRWVRARRVLRLASRRRGRVEHALGRSEECRARCEGVLPQAGLGELDDVGIPVVRSPGGELVGAGRDVARQGCLA